LQSLIALSDGQRFFSWSYLQLYKYLRRYDPELFKALDDREMVTDSDIRKRVISKKAKRAAGKINGIVRGYLDAIDRDQARCGIELAHTKRGSKYIDEKGNEVFEQSETDLPILAYLDEVDALAKANPSYARASKNVRAQEARALAGRISAFTPPKKEATPIQREIEMALKRAAGNVKAAIGLMRKHNYVDWAIRQDLRKHMPPEFFEIIDGETGPEEYEFIVEDNPHGGDSPSHEHVIDSAEDTRTPCVDDLHFSPSDLHEKAGSDLIPREQNMNKVSNPETEMAPTLSGNPSGSEVSNPGAAFKASLEVMDDFEVEL